MVKEVRMTQSQFKRFVDELGEGIGNDVVNALVRRVPVDTGLLKNSIRYKKVGKEIHIIMADYAKYVEYGTPPHIIRSVNAKALSWKSESVGPRGGKKQDVVFAKQVNHPGTRPQPFIRPTIKYDVPKIVRTNIQRFV